MVEGKRVPLGATPNISRLWSGATLAGAATAYRYHGPSASARIRDISQVASQPKSVIGSQRHVTGPGLGLVRCSWALYWT